MLVSLFRTIRKHIPIYTHRQLHPSHVFILESSAHLHSKVFRITTIIVSMCCVHTCCIGVVRCPSCLLRHLPNWKVSWQLQTRVLHTFSLWRARCLYLMCYTWNNIPSHALTWLLYVCSCFRSLVPSVSAVWQEFLYVHTTLELASHFSFWIGVRFGTPLVFLRLGDLHDPYLYYVHLVRLFTSESSPSCALLLFLPRYTG